MMLRNPVVTSTVILLELLVQPQQVPFLFCINGVW